MARRWTRRELLGAGLTTGAAVLAGCTSRGEKPTPQSTEQPSNSAVREVGFDGGDMVVELREDHNVSNLNLIGPDGRTFRQTTVPAGETTSHLEILDIRPGLGGYDHYELGAYELVAVQGESSTSLELELVPELRVVEVNQYRDGARNEDYGKLAVTIENIGTAPTWIYDITTTDAPNSTANDPFIEDPGIPRIDKPSNTNDLIIGPSNQQTYVGVAVPFLFTDQTSQRCIGEYDLKIRLASAVGDTLEHDISSSVSGEVQSAGLTGQYTCSEIAIEFGQSNE